MRYVCREQRRLRAVREAGTLNALEWVEVSDADAPSPALRQRTLRLRLALPAPSLGPGNVRIEGGERVPSVAVEWVAPATALPAGESPDLVAGQPDPATLVVVRTAGRGDFSRYTLRLVAGPGSDAAPAGFDPLLAAVELSFKAECPSDFDCAPAADCPPETAAAPAIDYLAKDHASFRRLMLDRMSLLAPGWRERSPADLGVTLVEMLAYVADGLSYEQDAVATEAFLGTARRRTSLRRHARLVDHRVHEGANARAWVTVTVAGEGVPLAAGTPLLTRVAGVPDRVVPGGREHRAALAAGAETFETLEPAVLHAAHARFDLWTWGDAGCCLPRGATRATLAGEHPALRAGEPLVLVEVASPTTGAAADADPARRHAVRLTHVAPAVDPSGGLFATPPTGAAVPVTEIAWDEADAVPFPLCLSVAGRPGLIVTEARGNVVLADHGLTVTGEDLGTVPAPTLRVVDGTPVPVRFRPRLARGPLVHARPAPTRAIAQSPAGAALVADLTARVASPALRAWLEERGAAFAAGTPVVRGGAGAWSVSDGLTVAPLRLAGGVLTLSARPPAATATLTGDPRAARPALALAGSLVATEPWTPRADLLASDDGAADVVAEVEHDGVATLRFGDGVHGRRPETGTAFTAAYRVGGGPAGNVGAEALAHVVSADGAILAVANPLAAAGGIAPEPAEAVRRDAPEAFLVQQRAVTESDYARASERHPRIQRAAATFRWTGSWHTVFVTADRAGGAPVDAPFERDVRVHLEPYRMAGYDLEVDAPRFVPIEVALHLCVAPEHFAAHVRAAALEVLSSRLRPDGTRGHFHPDNLTFGQPVRLSAVVAAAQAVPGVDSVTAGAFRRLRDPESDARHSGVLSMGRLEVARLDDDPNFPERGVLRLTAGGGK